MMGSDYVIKVVAWLISLVGATGVIAGILGFFGPVVISFNPWVLTIVGFLVLLFGYGMMGVELDDEIG